MKFDLDELLFRIDMWWLNVRYAAWNVWFWIASTFVILAFAAVVVLLASSTAALAMIYIAIFPVSIPITLIFLAKMKTPEEKTVDNRRHDLVIERTGNVLFSTKGGILKPDEMTEDETTVTLTFNKDDIKVKD